MSKFSLLFITVLTIILPFTILHSQTSGKISGKIVDKATGEPLPFANVFVEGTTIGTASDSDGNYTILNLKPGLYSITASVVGYQKMTVENVRINVDFTTWLNFELSIGAVDLPAVVVQGERNPLIRQDLTNPTVAITEESIQELPINQISDVIRLQAGVIQGDDGRLHIRGGEGNEIAFTLNGVALNDPYRNTSSIGLATNAVKEVSVSTGTFSAQYGNALSGVVNYITKEGGDRYNFSIRSYAGDYASNRTELFDHINEVDVLNRSRIEGTLGGPFPFLKDARFYVSGIYENFKGLLYGVRLYNPSDSHLSPDNFRSTDSVRTFGGDKTRSTDPYFFNPYHTDGSGLPTGDGSVVPINGSRSINFQGNISYRFSSLLKAKYEFVYDNGKVDGRSGLNFSDNRFNYLYNPDGRGKTYDEGLIQTFDITHTVSDNAFYTLKASYGENKREYYLYENPLDNRYLPSIYRRTISTTGFYSGGTDNYREYRKTKTFGLKGDIVAQLFKVHEIKAGFEFRAHDLFLEGYSVEFAKLNPDGTLEETFFNDDLLYDSSIVLVPFIPTEPSRYTSYSKNPFQLSAYIQDKMELASTFIFNAGLRYELFDPKAPYNPQLSQNLTEDLAGNIDKYNQNADPQHTLSPRVSLSYPITDRGIIRLSYGHFYQIGSLASLYVNPNFYVANVGESPVFGSPNVKPQKSIQYEIGLQQQLTDDFKFDLTGFYKDVSNYIYNQRIITSRGREYTVLTNLSYANVRGMTLSFFKRKSPTDLFSATLDYTFSIAEGNRTEPSDELFFSEQSGKQAETYLVPLSFDRSHVINATVALSEPDDWTVGAILNFQTGTPYSPSLPSNLVDIRYEQRSANQPIQWRVDLKVEKFFKIGALNYSVFLQVENLFDTENELSVYASSGRALSNVEQIQSAYEFNDIRRRIERGDTGLFGIDRIDNYYSQRPERVNRPREVRMGFSILFN
jgi:outer membrane receptor protein involved in Fe transport